MGQGRGAALHWNEGKGGWKVATTMTIKGKRLSQKGCPRASVHEPIGAQCERTHIETAPPLPKYEILIPALWAQVV